MIGHLPGVHVRTGERKRSVTQWRALGGISGLPITANRSPNEAIIRFIMLDGDRMAPSRCLIRR
ncbi:MAG: hypothetical protein KDI45_03480 [Candidatus Accumulibacter sp.]|nr:hypothetical protein [Accumulibacter sp.]